MRFSRQEYWSGVAVSFSKESSEPWDQTHISGLLHLAGGFFTTSTTSDILVSYKNIANTSYFENKQIKEQNCNNLESLFQFSRNLTKISCHTILGLNIVLKNFFFFFGLPKAKPFFAKNANHHFNHLFEKSIFLHSTSSKIFWPKVEMKRKLFPKFLLRSISLSFCLCVCVVLFCFVSSPQLSWFLLLPFLLLPSAAPG